MRSLVGIFYITKLYMSLCVCLGSCLCAAALLGLVLHKCTEFHNKEIYLIEQSDKTAMV